MRNYIFLMRKIFSRMGIASFPRCDNYFLICEDPFLICEDNFLIYEDPFLPGKQLFPINEGSLPIGNDPSLT